MDAPLTPPDCEKNDLPGARAHLRTKAQVRRENARKRADRLTSAKRKGSHSDLEWQMLLVVCGDRCLRCGSVDRLHKDHVTPIFMGGSDAIDNLQPLCARCNCGKSVDTTDYRPDWVVAHVHWWAGMVAAKESPTP